MVSIGFTEYCAAVSLIASRRTTGWLTGVLLTCVFARLWERIAGNKQLSALRASMIEARGGRRWATTHQTKRRCGLNLGAWHRHCRNSDQVCWIADNSQLAPRGRTKVQTSVASPGSSPPTTGWPVARSSILSTSEYRIATVA